MKIFSEESRLTQSRLMTKTPESLFGGEFDRFRASYTKCKITYVKPLPAFDSSRKSNVKLWKNLKKVFFSLISGS